VAQHVRSSPDGKSLIYMQGLLASQDFWLLDLASMKSRLLTRLQNRAAMRTFDVSSDGKQIVFDRLRENSQVVMIDLPTGIVLIQKHRWSSADPGSRLFDDAAWRLLGESAKFSWKRDTDSCF
jgi:Tol biopolymer transport system component